MNALVAFARVAQTGSFAEAARILNVTPAAVSQQVRRLEQFLDTKLLQKHGRGVLLTEEGQILSRPLQSGLEQMEQGIAQVARYTSHDAVRVTTSPSFAAHWLVPRISQFQMEHPTIAIQLDLAAESRATDDPGFDLAIRYCKWEDLSAKASLLKAVNLNVVCPHNLLPAKPWSLAKFAQLPWLQELGVSEIKSWYRRQGAPQDAPRFISEMPGNLIIEALKRGEAVSYVVCDWVQDELDSGLLQELWSEREKGAYYILTRETHTPAASVFLEWLQQIE